MFIALTLEERFVMNILCAGFSRVDVTPMMGIGLGGYFITRISDGVLDPLEINALALSCNKEKVILISIDQCSLLTEVATDFRKHISEVTGLPTEAIFLHATHTHTSPYINKDSDNDLEQEYYRMVYRKMADAAQLALADLKPARMGYGIGEAPNIAYIRRFRMKDGSVMTNPGVNNPNILEPIGTVDERVSILRFDREESESIVLVNFADHPDTVGGCKISADWPGLLRKTVEKTLDNTKCIFFNGAQGDVNHVNVHPTGGYMNDMIMDFDDVARGYGHTRYMGRVVAGGVLQAYDKVKYVDVDSLKYRQRIMKVPSNMPKPEELQEARRIHALHEAGQGNQLPYSGMMLTTKVAEAARMMRLENGPEYFDMELSGIAIGDIVFVGIPGEPFTGIGRALKEAEGPEMVIPVCLVNGKYGYFPMREAYEEGGYEAKSSNFRAGVAELIIEEGQKLIKQLQNN